MATIKSYPNNADEFIGAEYPMRWHHGRTSGVFAAAGNCAVAAVTGAMAVEVSDGTGWMADGNGNGIVWWVDTEELTAVKLQLALDLADGVLNRIDRVIVEWKPSNYALLPEVKILKGTNAVTPSAPALTNNASTRQISLAQIRVNAGTLAITAAMITDERLSTTLCGLVTENLVIDTSMAAAQFTQLLAVFQAALEAAVAGAILPHASTHAVGSTDPTAKRFTVAVTAVWTGTEAPYTQEISVEGVTADMVGKIDLVLDAEDALEDQIAQRDAFALVDRIDTGAGAVTLTCFDSAPEVAFNLQMEVAL